MSTVQHHYTESDMTAFCQLEREFSHNEGYLKGYEDAHKELHRNFDIAQRQGDEAMKLANAYHGISAANKRLSKELVWVCVAALAMYIVALYLFICIRQPQIAPTWLQPPQIGDVR